MILYLFDSFLLRTSGMNELRNVFAGTIYFRWAFLLCLHKFSILDALHQTPLGLIGIKGLTPPPGVLANDKESQIYF